MRKKVLSEENKEELQKSKTKHMPPPCTFEKGELTVHNNNKNLAKSPGFYCCYRS